MKKVYTCVFLITVFGILISELIIAGPNNIFMEIKNEMSLDNTTSNSFFEVSQRKLQIIEDSLENIVTSDYELRMPLVLAKKMWEKVTGQNMTTSLNTTSNNINTSEDVVIETTDGDLSYIIDDKDITDNIKRLTDFGQLIEESGKNFLFVETPFKLNNNISPKYMGVYTDYSEEKTEEVFNALNNAGLDVLSFTKTFKEQGLDFSSLFFKTDHHWLPQTGLYATGVLCNYLNEEYGYNLDTSLFDIENYDVTYAQNEFLGSQGKKVTEVYCEAENFPIVLPKYDIQADLFINDWNLNFSGNIKDILFYYETFDGANKYNNFFYMFYGYGDHDLITIHNKEIGDGNRVLLIKESFADCMYPYLASAVEYLDVIDLRAFDNDLKEYIAETEPDTVIVIYGISSFINDSIDTDAFRF